MNGWLQWLLGGAFVAGLAGGAHCAAMCGGIAAALRAPRSAAHGGRWRLPLAYSAGRIASYAFAGALAGALGQTGLALRGGAGLQHALMALAGLSLLLVALQVAGVAPVARAVEAAGTVLWRCVRPFSGRFLPADTAPRAFGLGLVWGWLPCGLVYAVLLSALATADPWYGALALAAFGLGTLPNVLAIGFVAQRLRGGVQRGAARYAAAAVIAGFGLYGLLHAAQPAAFADDGLLCRAAAVAR